MQFMRKLILVALPCLLSLTACGSQGDNPLSMVGIMPPKKEPIDYSPRPPLAIPPEEQRAQLPLPQQEMQKQGAPVQDVTVAPPPSYGMPAPVPENAQQPPSDTPWWVNPFGS